MYSCDGSFVPFPSAPYVFNPDAYTNPEFVITYVLFIPLPIEFTFSKACTGVLTAEVLPIPNSPFEFVPKLYTFASFVRII